MTYCVAIQVRDELVLASDSRSNAGGDQVTVCRKMHVFVKQGERVFVLLTSGSLSLFAVSHHDTAERLRLWRGPRSSVEPVRRGASGGGQIRHVSDLDREALEKDDFRFNVHILIGGQIGAERPGLYLVYPQGNPLHCTEDSPFLQIGEHKYGRPILDRGIQYGKTTLEQAAKYALISIDSTMRSNVTVGPPVDMLIYGNGELDIYRRRRFTQSDPDLLRYTRNGRSSAQRRALLTGNRLRDVRAKGVTGPIVTVAS